MRSETALEGVWRWIRCPMDALSLDLDRWAQAQFGTCELGDRRRNKRLVRFAAMNFTAMNFTARQCAENCIERRIELLTNVFSEESEHKIAVLLQEHILPTVTAIRLGASQMLPAVQLNRHARLGTQ